MFNNFNSFGKNNFNSKPGGLGKSGQFTGIANKAQANNKVTSAASPSAQTPPNTYGGAKQIMNSKGQNIILNEKRGIKP